MLRQGTSKRTSGQQQTAGRGKAIRRQGGNGGKTFIRKRYPGNSVRRKV